MIMQTSRQGLLFIIGREAAQREKQLAIQIMPKLRQHQFDALMSLHCRSDSDDVWDIVNLINRGLMDEAGKHFLLTGRDAEGDQDEALQERRIAEHILFNTGEYRL